MLSLMNSGKNLLKMKCVWTTHKILMFEKRQNTTMFESAMLIIQDFNYILQHSQDSISPALSRMVTTAI